MIDARWDNIVVGNFFVLNYRLPGPRWRTRSRFVLEYNNENMTFISLLLANSMAYIFRSNDKEI